jgi:hypothetical protein
MNDGRANIELLNQAFFTAVTPINDLIQQVNRDNPSLWRTKIARGVFAYGEGYLKKMRQFYAGTAIQDTTRLWTEVTASRSPDPATGDPGHDNCRYQSPVIGYGMSEKEFKLYETTRRTTDVCLRDIVFKWQFEQQLALMYKMLADVTLEEWENFARETYVDMCTKVLANDGMTQFTMARGGDEILIDNIDLDGIGVLTQDTLNSLYLHLYRQCPQAAVGNDSGMPTFALVSSAETCKELVTKNTDRREEFLYANPQFLIEGLGKTRTYQGFAHIYDPFTMRFMVDPADPTRLKRVWPWKHTATTIGDAIAIDKDYVYAPYELSVIFLKDVVSLQVPPPNPTNLSGHTFGGGDFMGDFQWLNIQDRVENPLKEKGYFFARYAAAPKPEMYSDQALCILHRRCTDVPVVKCNTATTRSASAQTVIAAFNASETYATNLVVILQLAASNEAHIGDSVTVAYGNSLTGSGVVLDDSGNGLYKVQMSAVKNVAGGWATAIMGGPDTPTMDKA